MGGLALAASNHVRAIRDVDLLIAANRDVIDFNYLASWVHRLNLMSDFSEVWREAFPDEATPVA